MDNEKSDQLTVRCPDCASDLVIDRQTGEVLFHKSPASIPGGGKSFDSLLAGLDEGKARADELFSREVSALKDHDRLMDEKFKEAFERAKDTDDDELPPRPWELD